MIDPTVLGGVVNDLAALEAAIGVETRALKGEFAKVGVPVTALNELTKVAAWLHGELPMLRRRQAAAVLLASQRMALPPGMNMQSVPEYPSDAFRLAGELAAQRILARLGDNTADNEIAVAAAAIRQITSRKGRPSSDDLAFLQSLYGGLGRSVYRLPGQLGNDRAAKSAVVDGLLLLSNDKVGGGFDKLPVEIRQDLKDTGWRYWNPPVDKATDPFRGQGFPDLTRFLLNRDPASGIAPGDEFATGLARSAVQNLRFQQWLAGAYDGAHVPEQVSATPVLNTTEVQQILGLVALSHRASATLISDPQALRTMIGHAWDDQGASMAALTTWAAKAALDPSAPDYVLAKRTTAALIRAVTTNGFAADAGGVDNGMFRFSLDHMQPEVARAFSKLIAANLADFHAAEPSGVPGPGDENHLGITTDQRYRFAMLASTDQQARVLLHVAAGAYKAQILANPTYDEARSLGFIDAMIVAAGHNAVYYQHVNDADAKNKVLAAARADDALVKSVAGHFFGEAVGMVPGGGLAVGAGKWVLSQLVDQGLADVSTEQPAVPTTVNTNPDATGFDVAENQGAYDLAAARLRADPTGKSTAGLPPEIIKHGSDGRPYIVDIGQLTAKGQRSLQDWAEQVGGSDYLKSYADTFRSYYGLSEKIEDGPEGLKNYVNASR